MFRLCKGETLQHWRPKKNRLALFLSKSIVTVPKVKRERERETAELKERIQLYSSLYVGFRSRQANLGEFLCHENYEYPPLLSDYGSIRKTDFESRFPQMSTVVHRWLKQEDFWELRGSRCRWLYHWWWSSSTNEQTVNVKNIRRILLNWN